MIIYYGNFVHLRIASFDLCFSFCGLVSSYPQRRMCIQREQFRHLVKGNLKFSWFFFFITRTRFCYVPLIQCIKGDR